MCIVSSPSYPPGTRKQKASTCKLVTDFPIEKWEINGNWGGSVFCLLMAAGYIRKQFPIACLLEQGEICLWKVSFKSFLTSWIFLLSSRLWKFLRSNRDGGRSSGKNYQGFHLFVSETFRCRLLMKLRNNFKPEMTQHKDRESRDTC